MKYEVASSPCHSQAGGLSQRLDGSNSDDGGGLSRSTGQGCSWSLKATCLERRLRDFQRGAERAEGMSTMYFVVSPMSAVTRE